MKKHDASYIAGLMDGEGCFRIDRFRTARSPIGFQYRPVIEVAMCDLGPIKFISEMTERHIQTKKAKSGKTVYLLVWRNGAAAEFANLLLPYLRGKRAQAEHLIHFNTHIAPGRGRTYSQSDFAICEEAHEKSKSLKTVYC